jgi:hypothetical protein
LVTTMWRAGIRGRESASTRTGGNGDGNHRIDTSSFATRLDIDQGGNYVVAIGSISSCGRLTAHGHRRTQPSPPRRRDPPSPSLPSDPLLVDVLPRPTLLPAGSQVNGGTRKRRLGRRGGEPNICHPLPLSLSHTHTHTHTHTLRVRLRFESKRGTLGSLLAQRPDRRSC